MTVKFFVKSEKSFPAVYTHFIALSIRGNGGVDASMATYSSMLTFEFRNTKAYDPTSLAIAIFAQIPYPEGF